MDERQSWVEADHVLLSVREQCNLLGLNRSSVYYTPRLKTFSAEQLALLLRNGIEAGQLILFHYP